MTTHTAHRMHQSSLEAHRALKDTTRRQAVLAGLNRATKPVTDAELANYLFSIGAIPSADPNKIRPRITDMINEGIIIEPTDRVVCKILAKHCRTIWLASRISELRQGTRYKHMDTIKAA